MTSGNSLRHGMTFHHVKDLEVTSWWLFVIDVVLIYFSSLTLSSPLVLKLYISDKNYSNLELTISLKRSIGYYMTEVFIPDILVVVMSWVSFWLHPDAVPGRVSLGAVTVLTISSQGSASRRHAPKVSYIKAVDIWTLTHILFVFAAMVEFSIVNVLVRRKRLFYEVCPLNDLKY